MNPDRPFARWSRTSLERAFRDTTGWIAESLRDFGRRWEGGSARFGMADYCDELDRTIAELRREQQRVDALAAELELRDHWAQQGRAREAAEEDWALVRNQRTVHYVRRPVAHGHAPNDGERG